MAKIKIEMSEENQTWLLRFLNKEWDSELEYQYQNNIPDTTYLEDMLEVYISLLGKPNGFIHAYCIKDDIESKIKELDELRKGKEIV